MSRVPYKTRIHELWLSQKIKRKITVFTLCTFLSIALAITWGLWIYMFSITDFGSILDNNAASGLFLDNIEEESRYFREYILSGSEDSLSLLEDTCLRTKESVEQLPFTYETMSELRYAQTWSIINSYDVYCEKRNAVLLMNSESPNYITDLYCVYDMQEYLQGYARTLLRYTLADGNTVYQEKLDLLRVLPFLAGLFGVFMITVIALLAKMMNKDLIVPIFSLVGASKKIAANDYNFADVVSHNRDEMGELVAVFNKMKHATGQYILSLEEKRHALDLLHKEELERLEIEKRLDATKFELLKNQMNPHFLFNTLNVISGMANLENATVTEKMIKCLSNIFRYNLKTSDSEVLLAQEQSVITDYLYLQQMRFGARISYHIECKVNENEILVPLFTFQPLIENAIIHGITKKEKGGKLIIRIWCRENRLVITVTDTGTGMTMEELTRLRALLKIDESTEKQSEFHGMGLSNICKRLRVMYKNSSLEIYSRPNAGTAVRIELPVKYTTDTYHKTIRTKTQNTEDGAV